MLGGHFSTLVPERNKVRSGQVFLRASPLHRHTPGIAQLMDLSLPPTLHFPNACPFSSNLAMSSSIL